MRHGLKGLFPGFIAITWAALKAISELSPSMKLSKVYLGFNVGFFALVSFLGETPVFSFELCDLTSEIFVSEDTSMDTVIFSPIFTDRTFSITVL